MIVIAMSNFAAGTVPIRQRQPNVADSPATRCQHLFTDLAGTCNRLGKNVRVYPDDFMLSCFQVHHRGRTAKTPDPVEHMRKPLLHRNSSMSDCRSSFSIFRLENIFSAAGLAPEPGSPDTGGRSTTCQRGMADNPKVRMNIKVLDSNIKC